MNHMYQYFGNFIEKCLEFTDVHKAVKWPMRMRAWVLKIKKAFNR